MEMQAVLNAALLLRAKLHLAAKLVAKLPSTEIKKLLAPVFAVPRKKCRRGPALGSFQPRMKLDMVIPVL